MRNANIVLTEQVAEAECDHDAAATNGTAATMRVGLLRDQHVTLMVACGGVVDMLLLAGVSMEEHIVNIPKQIKEVVRHVVRHGATSALAATELWSGVNLRDMAIGFLLMEGPGDVIEVVAEFMDAAGAIARAEVGEDVIRSAPHEV